MSLKRILNLTYLVCPSIQNFVYRVRTCFKFQAKKVPVWRGSNWQFQPKGSLKTGPRLLKTLDSAIHRINHYPAGRVYFRKTDQVIHWIEIYPVDSVIHLSNNWGQVSSGGFLLLSIYYPKDTGSMVLCQASNLISRTRFILTMYSLL